MIIIKEVYIMITEPLYPKSCWFENMPVTEYAAISDDMDIDVAIIGGGITGITCLYLLQQSGISAALFEGNRLFSGTTGHTTAKVTFQHDLFFYDYCKALGNEATKLYASSNREALEFIKKTVSEKNISCDFKLETSYVYTCDDNYVKKIENEIDAAIELDFPALYYDTLPLPIKIQAAIAFKDQASFHPIKYLNEIYLIRIKSNPFC